MSEADIDTAKVLERIAAEIASDPATDDLTVPLAIECARLRAELAQARAEARAEAERMRELLRECADDLAAEIEARYASTLDYPSQRARYDRDMMPVVNARAALSPPQDPATGPPTAEDGRGILPPAGETEG